MTTAAASTTGTRRVRIADAAIAVALAAVAVVSTAVLGLAPVPARAVDATAVALLAAAGLVLFARRQWPVPTLAANTVIIGAYLVLDYPPGLVFLSYAVAVYTVARHRRLGITAPASLGAFLVLLGHLLVNSQDAFVGIVYAAGWTSVPFAIGFAARTTREMAERTRAELVRTRVDEERLRVAQEVHDIVGHGLAAIKMQADVALHVLAKKPEQAQTALVAISRTSSEALAELRATLAVVREAGGTEGSPAPSLHRLGELRQRMAAAGLRVEVDTDGSPRELPPLVDLTGYRIVQESLTNVLRHSTADHATVQVRYAAEAVDLVVTNPIGAAVPAGAVSAGSRLAGAGSGVEGMRHRVQNLGGTFSAGPAGAGQFKVHAHLPTGAAT